MQEERKRKFATKLMVVSAGGSLFSFYNLTRFGTLSNSGRVAAVAGFGFFSWLSYAGYVESYAFGHSSAHKVDVVE